MTEGRGPGEARPADVDARLLDAAVAVLTDHGWDGVTLERVAERAGSSRVTLWRQGVTKDSLVDGLLARLVTDFVDLMWPVLASTASSPERLEQALHALCEVADRHLAILAVSDEVFHWAADRVVQESGRSLGFLDPLIVSLRAGVADGSLRVQGSITDAADAVFNTTCWGYVHLRARHRWARARARRLVVGLVVDGCSVR